jgi:uncharacterized protein (DUF2236 family)
MLSKNKIPNPPAHLIWRINREAVLLLGGLRALLMQIAHPAIAAGVYEHSNWQSHPYRRLGRTLWLLNQIIHGKKSTATKALHAINVKHAKIHGDYLSSEKSGKHSYHANDPILKKWVLATLIDSSVYAYNRWAGNLSQSECQLYYHEWKRIALLFEIPLAEIPEDYESFRHYVESMLHSGELIIDEKAKRIANSLLSTNRLLRNFNISLAATSLPDCLRAGFDLPLDAMAIQKWQKYDRWIRKLFRYTPPLFRYSPLAILAKLK